MAHRTDRMWLLGGVVVTVLLAAASWFIVIHPTRTDTKAVRQEVSADGLRLSRLRHQLAELDAKQKQLPDLQAQLKVNQSALPPVTTKPVDNSQAAFLNQLQISDIAVDVNVNALTVGVPVKSASVPSVVDVPITLAVKGKIDDMTRFLLRLQSVQARAVLVTSVGLSADTNPDGSVANTVTANVGLTAFETSAAATPTLTTK